MVWLANSSTIKSSTSWSALEMVLLSLAWKTMFWIAFTFVGSDIRQLLPGLPYTVPPKPARPDFLTVSSASIVAAACERDLPVADALNKTVAGVGPVVCREAAWRAFDGEHLLANELTGYQIKTPART